MVESKNRNEPENDREHFIPYLRDDVIEMCLEEGHLSDDEAEDFRIICRHLTDYLHCRFLSVIDEVKRSYGPFDPDRDTLPRENKNGTEPESSEELSKLFEKLATSANYFPLGPAEIEKSFEESTLIKLRTEVDLDDFEQVLCFARGDIYKKIPVRRLLRTREQEVDILQRVLLFLKFKDEAYFKKAGKKQRPEVQPGKIYLYFYKDVPKWDLEILFPNVRVGMRAKDKLMFAIPALGGGVGVLLKIIPQIVVLTGVILILLGAHSMAGSLGVTEETAGRTAPILTAILGVTMALGGLAVKQWTSYQKKRIQFLRDVSEQLFFRNLATNRSVFHRILDSAEEEKGKEMLLVLYHLVVNQGTPLSRPALDLLIEDWMKNQFDLTVDFDIESALKNLKKLTGTLPDGREIALLHEKEDGTLIVPPLTEIRVLMSTLASQRFGF